MAGETVYVTKDASASNLNDGSNATTEAWETYTYGFANVGQSNTLKIGTGVYSETRADVYTQIANGVSGNHTIVTDNGDGPVTLRRSGGWSGILYFSQVGTAHKYLTFQGTATNQLIFDGQNAAGMANIYLGNISEGNTDISLINCEIKDSDTSGVLAASCANVIIRGCRVHDNGSSTSQDHGVYCGGTLNALIENNHFYNNSANGFRHGGVNSSGLVCRNNLSYLNGGAGADGNGFQIYQSSGAQVYNNIAFKNANSGIHVATISSATIYHNSCHENKYGISLGQFGSPSSVIVKNNILAGNTTKELDIRSSATGTSYDWNIIGSTGISDAGVSSTNGGNNSSGAVVLDLWVTPTGTEASRDYSLKAGSDAIWNATTNNVPSVGIATDYAGTDRVHPDQGALAFGTPDPPDPPVIGHNTNYPVTAWVLTDIPLTIFDNDGNTVNLTLDGSTDGVSIEFGDTTNCTVT